MDIKKGEVIDFRVPPDMKPYAARVIKFMDDLITLSLEREKPPAIKIGCSIIITYNDMDFRADVESYSAGILKAAILWSDVREYFRVDDFIQIIAKKVEDTGICMRSRIFSGCRINVSDELTPDESINPVLWKMLVDIHSKLGLILERLNPDSESLMNVESKLVNISAAGICFVMDEKVEKGDMVEIKMFLHDVLPVGIATYGRVIRAVDSGNGQYNVALSFKDIEDEIKEEIIQYTLRRQREILKRQKRHKGIVLD
jgi:hypothetical protein